MVTKTIVIHNETTALSPALGHDLCIFLLIDDIIHCCFLLDLELLEGLVATLLDSLQSLKGAADLQIRSN